MLLALGPASSAPYSRAARLGEIHGVLPDKGSPHRHRLQI
jgi:hypothetical protein